MPRSLSAFVLALLLALPTGVAEAQSPETAISGRVTSATGAPLAGAEVILRQADSQASTNTLTDADGRFSLSGIAPGDYRLIVSAAGFSAIMREIAVSASRSIVVDVELPSIVEERVNVIGQARALDRLPGAGTVVSVSEIARYSQGVTDVHRVLRQVPGLSLQEEEGYGLRPNIGMRGSGSERSSKITLMEDGVLVAPAPYSAPAAYYFPTVARMQTVEVLKGASQVRFGPNTTGGVLNLVSTAIPSELRLRGGLAGGSDGLGKLTASLGDDYANAGWLVEAYQLRNDGFKQLDGGGDTGVHLRDYVGKFRVHSSPSPAGYQELEVKLGRTEQTGHETYLGLTDEDFALTPLRRYAASQADTFDSVHEQYQARYLLARDRWDVTAVAYRNDFRRAWYKLDRVQGRALDAVLTSPAEFAEELAILKGAASGPNALIVRNNNRSYYGAGVQTVLGVRTSGLGASHQWQVGLRYHADEEDRFQQDDGFRMLGGRMLLDTAGAPGSQDNRVGSARALAVFVSDAVDWARWAFTPGVRVERIDLRRVDYTRTDPARTGPTVVRENDVSVVVPGLGVSYRLSPDAAIFAGVHRGFAPPAPGSPEETDAERSVAYEVGARLRRGAARTEIVGFASDYDSLLGRDTLSSGGQGTGDVFNGGRAIVWGLEASTTWDAASRIGRTDVALPMRVAYTFTSSAFREAFDSEFEPWGSVRIGDEFPYLPRHQLFAAAEVRWRAIAASLEGVFVGRMRTVAGQGPHLDVESTDASFVLNASAAWRVRPDVSLVASVLNLTDRRYIAARAPAGVRPGLPRQAFLGLSFDLGPSAAVR
jgi:Fe(3+) dicitrate transport protein